MFKGSKVMHTIDFISRRFNNVQNFVIVKFLCFLLLISPTAIATANNFIDVCNTCTYKTLQSAVDAVPENNTELYTIRVAKGTYSGKTVVNSSKKIRIEGGWSEDFTSKSSDPSETILKPLWPDLQGIITVNAGTSKVIELEIENVKLTGAYADSYQIGGGISGSASDAGTITLVVRRCIVSENSFGAANGAGIGLASTGVGSSITFKLDSTLITQNSVGYYYGGGIYLVAYDYGVINADILNSIIADNQAKLGGGIAVSAYWEICCPNPHPAAGDINLNIKNSTITSNKALSEGIYGGGYGGGLKFLAGYGQDKNGSVKANIVNSIIWGNLASINGKDIYNEAICKENYGCGSSIINVSYSNIGNVVNSEYSSYNIGSSVLDVDPLFIDKDNKNYSLKVNSPMIDAGTSMGAPDYDFEGTIRPIGNAVDIGAYEIIAYTLTVSKSGAGTVTSADNGINCPDDCIEQYLSGTIITLNATPSVGYSFAGWGGDCSSCGNGSACNVHMDASKNCTATFAVNQYTITTVVSPSGGGSISCNPNPVTYGASSICTIIASPGYALEGVTGTCGGKLTGTDYTISAITGDCIVQAYFLNKYTLTLDKTGNGSGTVVSVPAGISCGDDCTQDYISGTVVTLTATPDVGSAFGGWSGACAGSSTEVKIKMNADKTCTATFTVNQYTLNVNKSGSGWGTVKSNPAGISCGIDCQESYVVGSNIQLTAIPDPNFAFVSWGGDCSSCGSNNICSLNMDGNKVCVATFDLITQGQLKSYELTISKGWNLLSSLVSINPQSQLTEPSFYSIWKWKNIKGTWSVRLPNLEDKGQVYASSKGFEFLSYIEPGEGFWVQSDNDGTFFVQGYESITPLSVTSGWNLVGLKTNQSIGIEALIGDKGSKILSVWKWVKNTWHVYLPQQSDKGASYAQAKGFGVISAISPGEGFWIKALEGFELY